MRQKIKIYCNHYPGGWHPNELETGMGGSEESLILLARELFRAGFDVSVFIPAKEGFQAQTINGVFYADRRDANVQSSDIFITFKDHTPFIHRAKGRLNFHLSCEVETPWNTACLDGFVHLSQYHESRHPWIPSSKSKVIPLGIDTDLMEEQFSVKYENQMLYCSSPDRGLHRLLFDWERIKEKNPALQLRVAYGWKSFDDCTRGDALAQNYKKGIMNFIKTQKDIEYLGSLSRTQICKEFWKSSFWVLPLNNPDSELFCLNALKARQAGALPVVNKFGALQNTVGEYLDYQDFILGKSELKDVGKEAYPVRNWEQVVKDFWLPLFENPNNPTRKESP